MIDIANATAKVLRSVGDLEGVEGLANMQIRSTSGLSQAMASELAMSLVEAMEVDQAASVVDWLAQRGRPVHPQALLSIIRALGMQRSTQRAI